MRSLPDSNKEGGTGNKQALYQKGGKPQKEPSCIKFWIRKHYKNSDSVYQKNGRKSGKKKGKVMDQGPDTIKDGLIEVTPQCLSYKPIYLRLAYNSSTEEA